MCFYFLHFCPSCILCFPPGWSIQFIISPHKPPFWDRKHMQAYCSSVLHALLPLKCCLQCPFSVERSPRDPYCTSCCKRGVAGRGGESRQSVRRCEENEDVEGRHDDEGKRSWLELDLKGWKNVRNRVNIFELVCFNSTVLINFIPLILWLQLRKASSLQPIPPPVNSPSPHLLVSFLLPIPLPLLAPVFSIFFFTPATCDFLCTGLLSHLPALSSCVWCNISGLFPQSCSPPEPPLFSLATRATQCSFNTTN